MIHQQEMSRAAAEALQEGNKNKIKTIKKKYLFLQKLLENILGLEEGSLILEEIACDIIKKIGNI